MIHTSNLIPDIVFPQFSLISGLAIPALAGPLRVGLTNPYAHHGIPIFQIDSRILFRSGVRYSQILVGYVNIIFLKPIRLFTQQKLWGSQVRQLKQPLQREQ